MITWVNKRPDLKVGSDIYLTDKPKVKWHVTDIYPGEQEAQAFDWHRKWTNNI